MMRWMSVSGGGGEVVGEEDERCMEYGIGDVRDGRGLDCDEREAK